MNATQSLFEFFVRKQKFSVMDKVNQLKNYQGALDQTHFNEMHNYTEQILKGLRIQFDILRQLTCDTR